MGKPYSRRDIATARKELRHLAKLSDLRLAEILDKRLLQGAVQLERKHGASEFATVARRFQDPKLTLARMEQRAKELGYPSARTLILDTIREWTTGEFLPGLKFVTTAELPKSMRALQQIESDEKLAQIIANRVNQVRSLNSQDFHETKPETAKSILDSYWYVARDEKVPIRNVLLGFFIDRRGGERWAQTFRNRATKNEEIKKRIGDARRKAKRN